MVKFIGGGGAEWEFDPADRIGESGGSGTVFKGSGPDGEVAIKRVSVFPGERPERRR